MLQTLLKWAESSPVVEKVCLDVLPITKSPSSFTANWGLKKKGDASRTSSVEPAITWIRS